MPPLLRVVPSPPPLLRLASTSRRWCDLCASRSLIVSSHTVTSSSPMLSSSDRYELSSSSSSSEEGEYCTTRTNGLQSMG
eukprot:CAMPEP_0181113990 /NCGR_PEP_ID=MMETSP1071-20121207/20639_1 /TAXON_ID=35127 /ORGANISM="Thalassiosira sp., Strain NH16" /LENGTH=79 /DNA_ID=CAMNT_0023198059 /DNA_START=388 /DNA_END=627 /DNA_ORIENTATION=+